MAPSERKSLLRDLEHSGRRFLDELWSVGPEGATRLRRLLMTTGRVAYITVEGFVRDLCLLRASALTFASLMGLVPILALTFAVLRGLGWRGERLETLILGKATILSPDAIRTIVSYIDNTNFAGLGVLGGSILFLTFVSVLTNIEGSLNAIWGNLKPRPFLRRVVDYFGLMVVGPLLLALATSLTATVQSSSAVLWLAERWGFADAIQLTPRYSAQAVVWLLFAFLYMFIPNTRVRFLPAAVGGVVAGSVWQLTQWAYIRFQLGMANYNAIYGALAQLPLLMAWVYVSWVIVLLGAEIASAVQNLGAYSRNRRVAGASGPVLRDYAGLAIAAELAAAAHGRRSAPAVGELVSSLDLPARLVREVLGAFARAGIAHVTADDDESCYLSLAPDHIRVSRIFEVLQGVFPESHSAARDPGQQRIREIMDRAMTARRHALESMTLNDLVVS